MPIVFTINKKRGFMISNWIGKINDDSLLKSFREGLLKHSDFIPGLHHIADLTGADVSEITVNGVTNLVTLMKTLTIKNENGDPNRVALIVRNLEDMETLGTYQNFFKQSDRIIKIFTKLDEALEWFNRDPRCIDDG